MKFFLQVVSLSRVAANWKQQQVHLYCCSSPPQKKKEEEEKKKKIESGIDVAISLIKKNYSNAQITWILGFARLSESQNRSIIFETRLFKVAINITQGR